MGKIDKYISHVTTFNGDIDFYFRKNIALYIKQLEKLLALNQLLNIAEYYNKIYPTDESSCHYSIILHISTCSYNVITINNLCRCTLEIIFNRKEDAQAVIDNLNFREILDTIYKN